MHELAYVTELIKNLKPLIKSHKPKQIQSIRLEISAMSGIEPASFKFYWKELTKQTEFKCVRLKFKRVPANIKCFSCLGEFVQNKSIDSLIRCQHCGSIKTMVVEDTTVNIKSISFY